MPQKRAVNVFVPIVVLMIGTVAVRLATGASAIPAIVAQAPDIGATSTAAAATAQAGVTAITASDVPPTPTVAPTPPPTFPPTPASRAIRASLAPTILPSSGSAIVPATPTAATPSSSTGRSSAWPVVITLAIIAIIVAAGIGGTRIARSRSLRR
ncbi:MAG: hypothetical protein ACR2M3_09175 [Thermomicrobiales bacterium]